MNGWGDYRPVKKAKTKKERDLNFNDVLKVFNKRYGRGTLVHPSMIDQYAGKKVVKLEDLDRYLGLEPSRNNGYMHGKYDRHEDLEDDRNEWEYKNVNKHSMGYSQKNHYQH